MTSPPPEAAGAAGGQIYEGPPDAGAAAQAAPQDPRASRASAAAPLPAATYRPQGGARPQYGPRPLPAVRAADSPVELTLDLRSTPPDKVIARLLGALERVSDDVTLLVLLRDTPEYVGVTSSVYQALRGRGYFSDSSRLPQGGQRLRVQRRRDAARAVPREQVEAETEYAPAPSEALAAPDSSQSGHAAWLPTPAGGSVSPPATNGASASAAATGDMAPRAGALDPAKMATAPAAREASGVAGVKDGEPNAERR